MPSSPRIRPAQPEERAALEALQWRASLANEGDREVLLAHPDAIELPAGQIAAGQVFVAERDGAVAGFSVVTRRPDGGAELDGLFVEPELFGQGIGRALVNHAAAHAGAAGAAELHVTASSDGEGFYHRCGFETVGPSDTRFGPAVALRRPL